MITILAHDPGIRNYGYAIVKLAIVGNRLHFRVMENGAIKSTITQMKMRKVREKERDAYLKEVGKIVKKWKPTFQIAERYMTRGIKGILIECVAAMLTSLEVEYPKVPLKLVPAVTWKQELKRCNLEMKLWYKKCKTSPHQMDAGGMAIYAAMKYLNAKRQKINVWKLITQLEETSKTKLANRVARR